jgi:hypothetical protein
MPQPLLLLLLLLLLLQLIDLAISVCFIHNAPIQVHLSCTSRQRQLAQCTVNRAPP